MKLRILVVAPAAALLLAGCMHRGGGMGGAGMGPGPAGGMGTGGDMAQMCSMYRQMGASNSPAERRAALEAQMRSMHGGTLDPQQMQARIEMMERQCAQLPANR